MKAMLTQAPVMIALDWSKIFHVYSDASYKALGGVLIQERVMGYVQPIYYASKTMSEAERNYNTIEREALGVVYAVAIFKHYYI